MQPPPLRPPSLARYPGYLALQVAKTTMRLVTEGVAELGMRLPLFAVLAKLDDHGAGCQQDLCDALDLDKSHMVGFIAELEDRGLVERERDEADRRRYRVAITPAGRRMLARLHVVEASVGQEVFGGLDPDERQTLVELLGRVVGDADQRRVRGPEPVGAASGAGPGGRQA